MRLTLLLAPIAALALSACLPDAPQSAGSMPAPAAVDVATPARDTAEALAAPTVDARAITVAFNALDGFLYAVDLAQSVGQLPAGSPAARSLASTIDRVRTCLNAASQAQRLGRAMLDGKPVSAAAAMSIAEAAFAPIARQFVKGN